MKKIALVLVMLLATVTSFAQSRRYLCEVKGMEKTWTSGLKLIFDFGDAPIYDSWNGLKNKQKFVDEKGKEMEFNSMVDAGNYMVSKGWTFLQAYTTVYGGNPIIHWIFYKDAESPEKAIEGIMTKEMFEKSKK